MTSRRWRWAWLVTLTMTMASLVACGDEEEEGTTSERPDDPCASKGKTSGIWGRVVAPSCATFVSAPEVTLYDALQFEVATTTGDDFGEFRFPASVLTGDGQYIVTVKKGPYSGPDRPMPFSVSGGQSDYQIVRLQTGGN